MWFGENMASTTQKGYNSFRFDSALGGVRVVAAQSVYFCVFPRRGVSRAVGLRRWRLRIPLALLQFYIRLPLPHVFIRGSDDLARVDDLLNAVRAPA